jgi:hypothetical protein
MKETASESAPAAQARVGAAEDDWITGREADRIAGLHWVYRHHEEIVSKQPGGPRTAVLVYRPSLEAFMRTATYEQARRRSRSVAKAKRQEPARERLSRDVLERDLRLLTHEQIATKHAMSASMVRYLVSEYELDRRPRSWRRVERVCEYAGCATVIHVPRAMGARGRGKLCDEHKTSRPRSTAPRSAGVRAKIADGHRRFWSSPASAELRDARRLAMDRTRARAQAVSGLKARDEREQRLFGIPWIKTVKAKRKWRSIWAPKERAGPKTPSVDAKEEQILRMAEAGKSIRAIANATSLSKSAVDRRLQWLRESGKLSRNPS